MTTTAARNRQPEQHGGCPRCRDLRQHYLDPATPNPGAYLYWWALHRLDDHFDTAGPQPGCRDCTQWAGEPAAILPTLWDRWARTHFLRCGLAADVREAGRKEHEWTR